MESKKCIAILIGLFLMITFVYIFGSPITGYGIYGEPNELTLKDYPYPFIKNGVYNHLNIVLDYQNSFDLGWELIEYIKDYRRTYPNILLEPKSFRWCPAPYLIIAIVPLPVCNSDRIVKLLRELNKKLLIQGHDKSGPSKPRLFSQGIH